MIRLYPEQLRAQLNEGLRAAYLLLGNDPLLQESQDAVREAAAAQGFTEHHTVHWITAPTGMPSSHSARR
jgi:DNA polymerase-3 subunit delta